MLAHALVAFAIAVTLVPALVAVRPTLAVRLYGLDLSDAGPVVALIVRRRAVFFGLTALLLGVSRVEPSFRAPAYLLAIASKVAFVGLALRIAPSDPAVRRIAGADVAVVAGLSVAAALELG